MLSTNSKTNADSIKHKKSELMKKNSSSLNVAKPESKENNGSINGNLKFYINVLFTFLLLNNKINKNDFHFLSRQFS